MSLCECVSLIGWAVQLCGYLWRVEARWFGVARDSQEWSVHHASATDSAGFCFLCSQSICAADSHIPDVHEERIGERAITALNNRQFCIVVNPVDAKTGLLRYGERELRRGEQSFFLQPGEELVGKVESIYVLSEEQALLLSAREQFDDGGVMRKPGDLWLKRGPCEYIPNVATVVVERRNLIPLDEGEGIYVRNLATGQINAIIGKVDFWFFCFCF